VVAVLIFDRRPILLALCLSAAVLAGCAVGPNYSRPAVPTQTGWKESAANAAAALPPEWWRIFNDTDLNVLETQAVEANQDLKRAVARVTEARALARASKADLYPSISASGAYSRNRLSENRATGPQPNLESDDFTGSFDLGYELDIWGRVRRSVEAARADASAVATDLQVVLLTLSADVARNYQLTEARYEQAVASYRGAILNAFREVGRDVRAGLGSLNELALSGV